jgi:protein TonB
LTASIAMHAGALAAIVTWQLSTAASTPAVVERLRVVVLPAPPPPPVATPAPTPPPIRPDAAPMPDPTRVPIEAANEITPERPMMASQPASDLVVSSTRRAGDLLVNAPHVAMGSAPPNRPAAAPVRVHDGIRAPRRQDGPRPEYPPEARAARVEGTVVLEATIDETGVVTTLKITQSIPLLDRAAVEAVSKWRYEPTRLNGQPVPILMTVRVTFSLK